MICDVLFLRDKMYSFIFVIGIVCLFIYYDSLFCIVCFDCSRNCFSMWFIWDDFRGVLFN